MKLDKQGRIQTTIFFKDPYASSEGYKKIFYSDTVSAHEKYLTWMDDHMDQIEDFHTQFTMLPTEGDAV